MDAFAVAREKSRWDWTLLLMVPDWIDHDRFDAVVAQVAKKVPLATWSHRSPGRARSTGSIAAYSNPSQ